MSSEHRIDNHTTRITGLEPSTHSAPSDPPRIKDALGYHQIAVTVRFTPPAPERPPRLKHIRDLWQLHRPHRPQHVLTAALFQTDVGRELRVGFSLTNLIHSELSRKGDEPLEAPAEDLRLVLLGQGWVELRAADAMQ